MRVGLMIPPQLEPRHLVPMAVRAEEQGFDFVACGEHVFTRIRFDFRTCPGNWTGWRQPIAIERCR